MARRAFDPDDPDRMARELARGSDNRYAVAQAQQQAFEAEKARIAAISPALVNVADIWDKGKIPDAGYAPSPGLRVDPPDVGLRLQREDFNPDGTVGIDALRRAYKGSGAEFENIPFEQWLSGPSSPWQMNAGGTAATYVPEKQTYFPSYNPADTGLDAIVPGIIKGIAFGGMGAGLLGALTNGAVGLAPGSLENFSFGDMFGGSSDWSTSFTNPEAVAGESFFNNTPINLANSGASAGDVANFLNTSGTLGSGVAPVAGASTFGPGSSIADMIASLSSGGSLISSGLGGLEGLLGSGLAAGGTSGMGSLVDILQTGGQGAMELGTGGNWLTNLLGNSPQSALGNGIKSLTGTDVNPGWLDLLGKGLGAGIGILGANQQNDQLQGLFDQMRGDRLPFLNKATGYLNDPNSFYSSPEATGASDAILRRLSTTYGNPGVSPTAQSMATGSLYDRYANTVNSLGSLGLSGQGIQADLGKDIVASSGQPYAIAGNAIGNAFGNDLDINQILAKALQKQYGLS